MNKIIPHDDYVLVKIVNHGEQTTAGGLVIPATAGKHRDLLVGEVVAAGQGRITEYGTPIDVYVKVGDKVLFPRGGGDAVYDAVNGLEMRIMRCCEIRATLEESRIVTL